MSKLPQSLQDQLAEFARRHRTFVALWHARRAIGRSKRTAWARAKLWDHAIKLGIVPE